MSTPMYAVGVVLALVSLASVLATPFLIVHSRSPYDHGPGCWWCHPRLLPRKRR
ncbi:hypothetical protein [Streptomyces sp. Tu 6176]|uniref:hypothetical protein n=1 Tax=Streptomyces sp. Tu 6176 TaxID=1470557 RepID=UPI000AE42F6E|nr:hypothetical protein [Streptomyces sp. Tu 6176]